MLNLNFFKNKLDDEKTRLEASLSKIAQPNPKDPNDWETKQTDSNAMMADITEVADLMEEAGNTEAMENSLEERLNKIKAAIKRIEDGTYGKCAAKGCHIEKARLEADPATATCIKHADQV